MVYMPTCLCTSMVYVPTCECAKSMPTFHFYMPTYQKTCHKMCQYFNLACQYAKRHANFSTWHASVSIFKHSSDEMLREISILYYYIKSSTLYLISYLYISCVCIVHVNCIILYFLKLFCSLVKNRNIKIPGFYML